MKDKNERIQKERDFYNAWGNKIDIDMIDAEKYFESSTCPENRYLLSKMGDIKNASILELGCGAGENSIYFSLKGANPVASDYSEGMLRVARKLAVKYKVKLETRVIDAMNIPYPDNRFDFVYAANTLHHVDFYRCTKEIYRVLKPRGKMLSWDPLKHNSLINIYRKMATKVRTEDEQPLDIRMTAELSEYFSKVEYETFWLSTLWIFIRFYIFEKVHPNDEPYWKKIVSDEERIRDTYLRLEKIDKYLKKIHFFRKMAWNVAIVATK